VKKYTKIITSFFLIISSIIFAVFLWDKIYFPFTNPLEIIGEYSKQSYNPVNDPVRYLIFISLPLLVTLLCCNFSIKNSFRNIKKQIFQDDKTTKNNEKSKKRKIVFFIFLIYVFLEFFSVNFPYKPIDLYHEGQILTPAFNNIINGGYWSNSYITVGVFFELFATSFIWKLLGLETIGAARLQDLILNLIFKISLLFLSYQITKKFVLGENKKILSFLLLSFVMLNLNNFNIWETHLLVYRDLPLVLFLIFFVEVFNNKNFSNFFAFVLGSFSVLSILWGLDRGAYLNLNLFLLFFLLIFRGEMKKSIFLIIGFSLGWIIFFSINAQNEAKFFIENSLSIYQNHGFINGIIHPIPFSDDPNSWRATKSIISILICGLILIYLFVFNNKKFSNQSKMLLVFVFIISITSYMNALSRSDGNHMKESFGFPLIFLSIFIINNILHIKSNFFYQQSKNLKKSFFLFVLVVQIFFLFLMSKFAIGYSSKAYSPIVTTINIENIKTFNSRFDRFINTMDDCYLDNKLLDVVNYYKFIAKNDKCVQIFNYDAAIPYLVKKYSCTKYSFIWELGSKTNQLKFIEELKLSKPNYILLHGPQDFYGGISASERLPYVYKYILDNYSKHKQIYEWIFYKIN
jgi:hypothetical protein|tara:strand:+ start:1798 stop:3690 length:1893 start_codon:yes stop_codon:yes gene_type:complete